MKIVDLGSKTIDLGETFDEKEEKVSNQFRRGSNSGTAKTTTRKRHGRDAPNLCSCPLRADEVQPGMADAATLGSRRFGALHARWPRRDTAGSDFDARWRVGWNTRPILAASASRPFSRHCFHGDPGRSPQCPAAGNLGSPNLIVAGHSQR